jgi:hypothetical protein
MPIAEEVPDRSTLAHALALLFHGQRGTVELQHLRSYTQSRRSFVFEAGRRWTCPIAPPLAHGWPSLGRSIMPRCSLGEGVFKFTVEMGGSIAAAIDAVNASQGTPAYGGLWLSHKAPQQCHGSRLTVAVPVPILQSAHRHRRRPVPLCPRRFPTRGVHRSKSWTLSLRFTKVQDRPSAHAPAHASACAFSTRAFPACGPIGRGDSAHHLHRARFRGQRAQAQVQARGKSHPCPCRTTDTHSIQPSMCLGRAVGLGRWAHVPVAPPAVAPLPLLLGGHCTDGSGGAGQVASRQPLYPRHTAGSRR